MRKQLTKTRTRRLLKPVGSVEKLRQCVVSAWIEAEAVGVDAERKGKVPDVLMVLKARDILREVMATLSIPPNTELTDRLGAGSVK